MVFGGVELEENEAWHLSELWRPSDYKSIQYEMLPEALQASLNVLLSKFLFSAVSGSHSELATNTFYYLRPFTQKRNKICIQAKHVFMQKKKNVNNWRAHRSPVIMHKDREADSGTPSLPPDKDACPSPAGRKPAQLPAWCACLHFNQLHTLPRLPFPSASSS